MYWIDLETMWHEMNQILRNDPQSTTPKQNFKNWNSFFQKLSLRLAVTIFLRVKTLIVAERNITS